MRGCGHSKTRTFCSEDCAMENHDRVHDGDPAEYWADCQICTERVEADIENGKRNQDGELIEEDSNVTI